MDEPGKLWIGAGIDPQTRERTGEPLALEAPDLTTHGAIVGMTGSGKTGLAVVLLEEALLQGIPVLAIDPKGDLGNLLLQFPELSAADFEPWVNESDARQDGVSVADYAAKTAQTWKDGLAGQGIPPERIQRLKESVDFTIYTPGSTAGVPLNVVGSLRAPTLSWDTEAEALRDEIEGTVTSLLALVGIQADPISSREHVLLANLVENAWRQGRDLDLGALIGEVQSPPLRKLGVFELDAFFPPKDRNELALKLNALVASPSFAAWSEGPPIDPAQLLSTEGGRPRCSIVYLAHLSDEERQFVVTLLLSKVVTWFRGLAGTSDLRALVYMDEVFGFVPPTAAPPAKKPILTILKQARAFGVGMVLATQNPVDLDYKAMSNAATWLVGRLQTERDKERVLAGLESAAGGVDVSALGTVIGGLEKRQFLLQSAHEPKPAVFQTRWAMSYLRGPLTREQIATLMAARKGQPAAPAVAAPPPAPASTEPFIDPAAPAVPPAEAAAPAQPAPALGEHETPVAPQVAAGVTVYHLDPAAHWAAQVGANPASTTLHAALAIRLSLRYDDAKAAVDHAEEWEAIHLLDQGLDLSQGIEVDYDPRDFRAEAPPGAVYTLPGVPLAQSTFFKQAGRDAQARVVESRSLHLFRNPALKLYSRPGETEEQFLGRCDEAAQREADAEAAKLKDRLGAKADRLRNAIADAEARVHELEEQERREANRDLIAGAGAVLGALFGGRRRNRDIARAAERVVSRGSDRTFQAQAKAARAQTELAELEQEILDQCARIDAEWDENGRAIEPLEIGLERADVKVAEVALVWIPR
ncbi:MAG: DUF87 domain-containing protein [Thermoleophilia bacterium]